MNKKKIVSIEDRIPKLKQVRKKKANRRLVFYLSIFFLLISIIVYLQSPLSNIKTITITGNSFISKDEIISKSNLTTKMSIWAVNQSKIEQQISENPIIESVKVIRILPWTVDIQLTEHERVGYIKKENELFPILGSGITLSAVENSIGDAPLILEFTEDAYLSRMTSELQELPKSILNLISEIHWKPTEKNKNKIYVYMNDGFIVDGTIRNFADRMQVYPSIVSQLDVDHEGIIHIGVGAYFEGFEKETAEDE